MTGDPLDRTAALARSALLGYEGYTGPWGDYAPKIADAAVRLARDVLALVEVARAAQTADKAYWSHGVM